MLGRYAYDSIIASWFGQLRQGSGRHQSDQKERGENAMTDTSSEVILLILQ